MVRENRMFQRRLILQINTLSEKSKTLHVELKYKYSLLFSVFLKGCTSFNVVTHDISKPEMINT